MSQVDNVTKRFYEGLKLVKILWRGFGKPRNWKNYYYPNYFKFWEDTCEEI